VDAAACIGCGACVASCPNALAMFFVSGKVSHFIHHIEGLMVTTDITFSVVHWFKTKEDHF
jgi:ferredoxin